VFTIRKGGRVAYCGLLAVVALTGCGGPYDASVAGVVTLDGSVVPTGAISFVPANGGPPAYAIVDQSGKYQVFTGREAGLPSGEYNVTVVARESSTTPSDGGGPPPPGKAITPRWYASLKTSGLTFKVEPGSNNINLELTSTPPAGWQEPAQRGRR
jgi:hypothetical protein